MFHMHLYPGFIVLRYSILYEVAIVTADNCFLFVEESTTMNINGRSIHMVYHRCNLNQFISTILYNDPTNTQKRNYTDKLSQEYKEENNEEY